MSNDREKFTFPTRNYPYRHPSKLESNVLSDSDDEANRLEPKTVYKFILGLNTFPVKMTEDEVTELLCDPFSELFLKRGVFPQTLRQTLSELDIYNNDPQGLPEQKVFLAADGGQIPWTPETANVNRQFRFAIARSKNDETTLLISSSTIPDSSKQFLQILGWDSRNQVYNYYERRGGTWVWAGNSHHALADETRGRGPFDSHVNGSLVMKELRTPWINWHSMDATIQENTLSPDDALRTEPLFKNRVSAHELEKQVIRPGIIRWNQARLKHCKSDDGTTLSNIKHFFRQILTTTTINLVSSENQSKQVKPDEMLKLPIQFFLNTEALLDLIELEPNISIINVSGQFYKNSLAEFDFELVDKIESTGEIVYTQKGDTFFAFLVPEPAFEDTNVLDLLIQNKLVSRKFAASLLIIDFQNPIFSAKREQLMKYVPKTAQIGNTLSDIENQFVASVEAEENTLSPDDAAYEFLNNWRLSDDKWRAVFEERIEKYFAHLLNKSLEQTNFYDWTRLAESRRREFSKRPLKEFSLTTPKTNIPEDESFLMMQLDGTIQPKN